MFTFSGEKKNVDVFRDCHWGVTAKRASTRDVYMNDSFRCIYEWFIQMYIFICDMTNSYVTWWIHVTPVPAKVPALASFHERHPWMYCDTYEWVMSHVNESCHIRMSHATYEWVMSHRNESCHIRMNHVTCEWVMSHMNASCHTWTRHVTYDVTHEWVMSPMDKSCHVWMSHVALTSYMTWVMSRMNASCHIWMHHVTYEWVISHMNASFHIWMYHVTSWNATHHAMPHT